MGTPTLFILMRNDLGSMNPGKAIAQGSHAANAFTKRVGYLQSPLYMFRDWENATPQGFGTVLTLEGKMRDIYATVDMMKSLSYVTDIIHDPTYPIIDGEIVHHIPLDTCAYVFVPDKDTDMVARTILSQYQLHK